MALSEKWLLDKANKRLSVSGMDKDVAALTREVIKEMHKQGIYVGVAQAFRSKAEQNQLYAQGRTTAQVQRAGISGVAGQPSKNVVTNAIGGQSNHNYGVAVDLFQYSNNGEVAIWKVDTNFKKIVAAMKKKGFKWGGDWTSFKDYPHFELYDKVGGQTKPNLNAKTKKHVVKSGDTLGEIAIDYNVTVADIMSLNPKITNPSRIYVGQLVVLPAKATYTGGKEYHVKRGDTLSEIAAKHNIKLSQLLKVNPQIKRPEMISIGQVIQIPKG